MLQYTKHKNFFSYSQEVIWAVARNSLSTDVTFLFQTDVLHSDFSWLQLDLSCVARKLTVCDSK